MISQENSIGKPLADANWLENHHRAKITERTVFAKRLLSFHPKKIVDLGCATGLWFELLDSIFPDDCEFVGIDSDQDALNMAIKRSESWKRKITFMQLDLEDKAPLIPAADLTLAFNIFPYIKDLDYFINTLASRSPCGILAVRQYDGASIRFGPMSTSKRQMMEMDLRVSTENSQKFQHYDMDRTFSAIRKSAYKNVNYEFELFERFSPFNNDFIPYYNQTMLWTYEHLSERSAVYLKKWMDEDPQMLNRYFYEVDLVALLS